MVLSFWMIPVFFLTALIYASVGFGGGSSYLAVLAMTPLPLKEAAVISLFCNLIVSGGGVWHFSKAGQMRLKLLMPFLFTSIPAAYAGGLLKTGEPFHRLMLGLCLLFVAWRVGFGGTGSSRDYYKMKKIIFIPAALLAGGLLGFLSGFLGIGGGIFLSPLLILSGWMTVKESSAAASLFILLNSMAGLLARGLILQNHFYECFSFGITVLIGGQLGSRAGAYHFPSGALRKILAGFISWAGLRLLWVAL